MVLSLFVPPILSSNKQIIKFIHSFKILPKKGGADTSSLFPRICGLSPLNIQVSVLYLSHLQKPLTSEATSKQPSTLFLIKFALISQESVLTKVIRQLLRIWSLTSFPYHSVGLHKETSNSLSGPTLLLLGTHGCSFKWLKL